jgi:hypothetical protein
MRAYKPTTTGGDAGERVRQTVDITALAATLTFGKRDGGDRLWRLRWTWLFLSLSEGVVNFFG